ncbi:hypothetical protein GUITHDRAFT_133914 [Guillardia theta CCMP2712]|uniref:protein-tyrosine-phosphatase n=1 Tax=Guillardia theta (strain CCMP2712) TaxID=905079 RepID=L1JUE7_GUITC|nr:hypothetical protein GUITHDRAFT_133914 [Guillardia theta CCMP2712]EKX52196.1 hypothetical protein GUITHDRAFT_133914 [Guillardia theta CCMP2712]|eukprot:XP_005839176.1 hypothetical protein GUITHDRAFT_133914 [Guillardia theta CCMP2712]
MSVSVFKKMSTDKPFREDETYHVTSEISFMGSDSSPRHFSRDQTLQTEPFLTYFPFCSDFGPLNLRMLPGVLPSSRAASYHNVGFEISVFDAWRAVEKANREGWLKPEVLDLEGPVEDIPEGSLWVDNHYVRMFHPRFYLEVFEEIRVKTVVRLNAPNYDPKFFEDADMEHVDLFCEDCSVPPTQVIFHFLQLLQRVDGMVAVHCDTGLGVAAMLVATYLISFHSFTAREAISWVRIMRPGSIIGMQQLYLEEKEKVWRDAGKRMQTRCAPDVTGIADLRIRKDDSW